MLLCADQRAAHWTALDDPKFVRAVLAAERRFGLSARRQQPPSPALAPPPSGKGELVGEFPLDDFRPHWLARGWRDSGLGLG